MKLTAIVFLALIYGLMSCGSRQPRESLSESVTAYNEGVRWGRFADAAARMPIAQRAGFLDERDKLANDLKITEYEVIAVDHRSDRAMVHVKFSWFLTSKGTVSETVAVQSWRKEESTWVMYREEHLRGDEMPGLSAPDLAPTSADTPPPKLP